MLRRFPCRWLRASAAVLLVIPACGVPACAQQSAEPAADITFALRDADHIATWPVAIREFAIDGKPIRFDRPVHVQGSWLRTVAVTLRNVSPKTIVQGGINLVFPESGDGSEAHPYEACWSQQGQVPKIVYLGHDGYHLPPGYDLQKPLQLAPGASIRLTFMAKRIWQPDRAKKPPSSFRGSSTTAVSSGTAGRERSRIWEWLVLIPCSRELRRERMPMPPASIRPRDSDNPSGFLGAS
jgi:hypothetical protein